MTDSSAAQPAPKKLIAGILVLLALASGILVWRGAHPPASTQVARYLDALVDGNYSQAYAQSVYAKYAVPAVAASALSLEHFSAAQRAHPLARYRVQRRTRYVTSVTLVYRNGGEEQRNYSEYGPFGEVVRVGVTTAGGPLPGFSVDGVAVSLKGPQAWESGFGGQATGYEVYMIRGSHTVAVPAGPVTEGVTVSFDAQTQVLSVGKGPASNVHLVLSANVEASKAATAAVQRWAKTCRGDCRVIAGCSSFDILGLALSAIQPSTLGGLTAELDQKSSGVQSLRNWALAVRGSVRGQTGGPFSALVTGLAGSKLPVQTLPISVRVDFPLHGAPSVQGACIGK